MLILIKTLFSLHQKSIKEAHFMTAFIDPLADLYFSTWRFYYSSTSLPVDFLYSCNKQLKS